MSGNAWFALFIGLALGAPGVGMLLGLIVSEIDYRRERRERQVRRG